MALLRLWRAGLRKGSGGSRPGYHAAMRLTLTLVLAGLLLTTSCASGSSGSTPACEAPLTGQVVGVCDGAGTVVISLGAKDGVRPGDTLDVTREGRRVTTIIIHEVKDTQAVGTATGVSEQGGALPGDKVMGDE